MNHDHNTNLLNDQPAGDTHLRCVVEHPLTISHSVHETHSIAADGRFLLNDQPETEIHRSTVVEHPLTISQRANAAQKGPADGHLLLNDQSPRETHRRCVVEHPLTISHLLPETHVHSADGHLVAGDGEPPIPTAKLAAMPKVEAPSGWDELRLCADLFYRAQAERIAVSNRLLHTDADIFGPHLAQLKAIEHQARLMLRRCYRRVVPVSLRQLQQNTRGLGEDLFARILGHLGDPYIATPHWWEGTGSSRTLQQGEPYVRTIGQLWQYCGHGAPKPRYRLGMTATDLAAQGSPNLKMLIHLQAECCMKAGGPYRDIYDQAKTTVADKGHTVECIRCGPSGKPAQPETAWANGHKHAHALRIVGKHILRDMWLARHHEEGNQ